MPCVCYLLSRREVSYGNNLLESTVNKLRGFGWTSEKIAERLCLREELVKAIFAETDSKIQKDSSVAKPIVIDRIYVYYDILGKRFLPGYLSEEKEKRFTPFSKNAKTEESQLLFVRSAISDSNEVQVIMPDFVQNTPEPSFPDLKEIQKAMGGLLEDGKADYSDKSGVSNDEEANNGSRSYFDLEYTGIKKEVSLIAPCYTLPTIVSDFNCENPILRVSDSAFCQEIHDLAKLPDNKLLASKIKKMIDDNNEQRILINAQHDQTLMQKISNELNLAELNSRDPKLLEGFIQIEKVVSSTDKSDQDRFWSLCKEWSNTMEHILLSSIEISRSASADAMHLRNRFRHDAAFSGEIVSLLQNAGFDLSSKIALDFAASASYEDVEKLISGSFETINKYSVNESAEDKKCLQKKSFDHNWKIWNLIAANAVISSINNERNTFNDLAIMNKTFIQIVAMVYNNRKEASHNNVQADDSVRPLLGGDYLTSLYKLIYSVTRVLLKVSEGGDAKTPINNENEISTFKTYTPMFNVEEKVEEKMNLYLLGYLREDVRAMWVSFYQRDTDIFDKIYICLDKILYHLLQNGSKADPFLSVKAISSGFSLAIFPRTPGQNKAKVNDLLRDFGASQGELLTSGIATPKKGIRFITDFESVSPKAKLASLIYLYSSKGINVGKWFVNVFKGIVPKVERITDLRAHDAKAEPSNPVFDEEEPIEQIMVYAANVLRMN
jgi:hypothetical protein